MEAGITMMRAADYSLDGQRRMGRNIRSMAAHIQEHRPERRRVVDREDVFLTSHTILYTLFCMETIERLPLREQIHRRIIKSLIAGDFKPGSKIKDTEVSELLGISRTPAREALLRLEQEGFLKNLVGRGFVVQPLDPGEPEEIYPLIIELECMALRLAPLPDASIMAQLRQLGDEIGADDTPPLRRLELDVVWHGLLVERCNNSHLLRMVSQLKLLIQRYLHAYILTRPDIRPSVDEHGRILDRLEVGDVDGATDILTNHWRRNLDVLRAMIGNKNP